MTRPSPRVPRGWRRLAGSFAFRLGAAFAAAAIIAAAVTAVVVNAAFGARFRAYLQQQHQAQVTSITLAADSSYAGNGKWDLRALQALIQAAGTGTVTIQTPSGHDVWQWDGHSMSWNDQWMQGSTSSSNSGSSSGNGSGGGNSGSGRQGGCGSWEHCSSGGSSSWDSRSSGGWNDSAPAPAGGQSAARLAAVTAASPSSSPAAAAPGGAQTLSIPVKSGGKTVGTAVVTLPAVGSLPDEVAFRGQVVGLVLAGGAAGAMVSMALGIFFARRATRPVRQVTRAARAMAAGDRAARSPDGRRDEFGELSRAFNTMADAAETQEKLRQGFAAEVAHELRTPLTILRSQVEGLRVGVLTPDTQALGSLDEEVQRMTRLVADLQVLGSADAAAFTLQRQPVDLAEIADQTARQFAGLAGSAGIVLQTRLQPAPCWADPVRAAQIVANLLSNALKYTPDGGQVRIQAGTDGPWAVLTVADNGPGIPADELPHVFDRFYRGRTARPAGTGIGLTVVAELAAAHGGTAQVTSQPGQGSVFTVRLPAPDHTPAEPALNRIFTAAS
jgi:two-component system, OmpR family, sensor histidine kinase BaeS